MLFDTHAHLDADAFDEDREELIASLPGQNISLVMNPGCDLASSRKAVEMAERYDFLYAAVGSHPDAANEVDALCIDAYRALAKEVISRTRGKK